MPFLFAPRQRSNDQTDSAILDLKDRLKRYQERAGISTSDYQCDYSLRRAYFAVEDLELRICLIQAFSEIQNWAKYQVPLLQIQKASLEKRASHPNVSISLVALIFFVGLPLVAFYCFGNVGGFPALGALIFFSVNFIIDSISKRERLISDVKKQLMQVDEDLRFAVNKMPTFSEEKQKTGIPNQKYCG